MPKNEPRWDSRVDGAAFVSHWTIKPAELDRLAELRHLTLWNVRFPACFRFADLSALELLDIRGGSRSQLDYLEGAVTLRGLVVNQVRGLADLSVISGLTGLRILTIYGLAQVERLPDLTALTDLERLEIGQLRALSQWHGLTTPPRIREVFFENKLNPDLAVIDRLALHPTLESFHWSSADVPARISEPVCERLSGFAAARAVLPEAWLAEQR